MRRRADAASARLADLPTFLRPASRTDRSVCQNGLRAQQQLSHWRLNAFVSAAMCSPPATGGATSRPRISAPHSSGQLQHCTGYLRAAHGWQRNLAHTSALESINPPPSACAAGKACGQACHAAAVAQEPRSSPRTRSQLLWAIERRLRGLGVRLRLVRLELGRLQVCDGLDDEARSSLRRRSVQQGCPSQ